MHKDSGPSVVVARNSSLVPRSVYDDAAVAAPRLAAAGNLPFLERLYNSAKEQLKAIRPAGVSTKALPGIAAKVGIPLAGLAALGAAGQEFDDDEGLAVNTAQAGGRFVGDLGTNAVLAIGGGLVGGPVGAVALPVLASLLGVQENVGSGLAAAAGGITEAIVGEDGNERALRQARQKAMQDIEIQAAGLEKLAPIMDKVNEMNAARMLRSQEQQMQLQTNYNFANNLNQAALQRNNAIDNARLVAMQELL